MALDFDVITGLNTENSALLAQDTKERIQKFFSDAVPKNQLNPILPSVPETNPGLSSTVKLSQTEKSDLAIQKWLNDTAASDKDLFSGAGKELSTPAGPANRYLSEKFGYNPFRDNENFYAEQQHWYTEIPKAILLKFPALVGTKTGTGLGYLAGLIDPENWNAGYITTAADNAFARFFEKVEDNVKNKWLTTFQETADQNKGFFSRAFTDLNFWTDDVVDGAAFMASAFIPGLTLSKIGAGAKAAAVLARLGIASENGVLGTVGLENVANYMRNAQSIANGIDKTLIVSLNTASEAMWEAKGVRDNVISSYTQKINPATGRNYTDSEARSIAGEAAMNTFLFNVAALSVSNVWETNLLYKALGKGENSALKMAGRRLGKGYESIKPVTMAEKILSSRAGTIGKSALAGLGVEGFWEENIQLAIQRTFEETGRYKGGVLNQYLHQTVDALQGNDTETSMNIGLGAILGILGGAYSANKEYAGNQKFTSSVLTAMEQGEKDFLSFGDIYARDVDGNLKSDKSGKPIIDTEKVASLTSSWAKMSDLKVIADNTQNETLLQIYKNEQLARWAKAHIDANKVDLLYKKLEDATRFSDKELIELGYDPLSNPDRMAEVTAMKAYVRSLDELNETITKDVLKSRSSNVNDFNARRNYLYSLGARQLSMQQQSESLSQKLTDIRSRIDNTSVVNTSDTIVDQLNFLQDRISSQEKLLQALDTYDSDGSETNRQEEEKLLKSLQQEEKAFIIANKQDVDLLRVNPDGRYLYADDTKNKSILQSLYQRKNKEMAALTNTIKSVNSEFYNVADVFEGEKYFKRQIADKVSKLKNDLLQNISPTVASTSETPTGKIVKVPMANNTEGGPEIEVELEEGRNYLGNLSKSVVATTKGIRATIFNNDNIKIIKIGEDGSITVTVNGDAAVTFTKEEFRKIPAIRAYHSLTPLQKFYLANRNKSISYRIPIKYDKTTKKWETKIVSGRLSYNKKDDIVEFVYLEKGKNKRIEFNQKFVTGEFDLTTLSSEEKQGLQAQQRRVEKQRIAQIQLFEELINNTESEIDRQKARSADIGNRMVSLEERLLELNGELDKFKQSFEESDKTKIEDKRTKASKLSRLIDRTEAEITEINSLKEELLQEKKDLGKRQMALKFYQDQYYSHYDELLTSGVSLGRAELDFQTSRMGELRHQEEKAGTINETTAQIEDLLQSFQTESEIIDNDLRRIEDYEHILTGQLKSLLRFQDIIQLLTDHPEKKEFQTWLKHTIRQEGNSDRLKDLKTILNRLNSNPTFYQDVSWLVDSLKESREEKDKKEDQKIKVKQKLDKAALDLETRQELNQIRNRVNQLKDVFTGLTNQFRRNQAADFYKKTIVSGQPLATARTLEDAKRLQELESLFSEFLTEPPDDQIGEEAVLFGDSALPEMTPVNNPLFKTADSHYPGNLLNDQEYTRRFFKFTSQVSITPDLFLMPVTADNDGRFGANIRYIDDLEKYPDDIKLVVFRKKDGKYHPIDLTGQIITDPDVNQIVYSSMYGHKDLLSSNRDSMISWARKNFATKDLTDDQIHVKLTEYLQFRNWIKDQVNQKGQIFIPLTGKSNGIQNREPKDTATGRPQQLPVEGRITLQNPSWEQVDLIVSTTNGEVTGASGVKLKQGRTAIRRNGNIIQVYNRQLTEEDKGRIKRILQRLSVLLGVKTEYDKLVANNMKLSESEERRFSEQINQSRLYTKYLSSIIYWRGPKEGVNTSSKQWYIAGGRLYKGDQSIPFTTAELEKNLDGLLEGVYHQVASVLLNETYKNNEYQVLDVGEDGNLEIISRYDSYKEYLLSSKNRTADQIPIYTNIVSNEPENSGLPQLKNSYLRFSMNSEDQAYKPSTEKKTYKQAIDKNVINLRAGEYKLVFENSAKSVVIGVTLIKDKEFSIRNITAIKGDLTDTRRELMDYFVHALNNPENEVFEKDENIVETGLQVLEGFLKKGSEIALYHEIAGESVVQTPPVNLTNNSEPDPITPSNPVARDPRSILDDLNNYDGNGFNVDYRLSRIPEADMVTENLAQVKSWFQKNLPQIDLKITDRIIDGKAWGAFRNNTIYLYEGAETGTAYHEAFEAVYRTFLTEKERQDLIDEYKRRPNYKQVLGEIAIQYPYHSENDLIKEALAEEFRDFVLNNQSTIIAGQGKRNGFFRRLWNTIKALLNLPVSSQGRIEELFSKIDNGYFSSVSNNNSVNNRTDYRQIGNISQEITGYTIEGITALFFNRLWQSQENTESLFNKNLSAGIVNSIWKEVGTQLRGQWTLTAMKVAAIELGIITKDQAKQEDSKLASHFKTFPDSSILKIQNRVKEYESQNIINRGDQITILSLFNTEVFDRFSDYLKQFSFVLNRAENENEEQQYQDQETEETKVKDPLGIRDTLQIDTRNTASTTIKLLLASLTKDYYNKEGQIKTQRDPYMGLPRLVDYNSTINTLFNDLNGIVTVYRDGSQISALDQMMEKLEEKYRDPISGKYRDQYVWIERLKKRIKYQDNNGDRISAESLTMADTRLLIAFTRTFMKNRNRPSILIVGEEAHIFDTDPVEGTQKDRIIERWENNAKGNYQINKEYLLLTNNEIHFNKESKQFQNLLDSKDPYKKLEFLEKIGITFSIPANEIVQGKYAKSFASAFDSIKLHIKDGGIINSFDDLFSKQIVNGPINTLINIEIGHNGEESSLQYRNPEGETENSIISPSCITTVINSLQSITNLKDFILSNPQLGRVNDDGSISLHPYQQNSVLLRPGGILFDKAGKKKKNPVFHIISGITGQNEGDGVTTANLKQSDKIVQELHYLLKNWHYVLINSDKSSEYAIEFSEFISMFAITSGREIPEEVINIYQGHLEDEINSLILLKNKIGSDIQYYSDNQYDNTTGKWLLSHFRNIITSSENDKQLQEVIAGKVSVKEFINSGKVNADIQKYLNSFIKNQQNTLLDLGVIKKNLDGTYTTNAISKELLSRFSQQGLDLDPISFSKVQFDNISRYLFFNHQIGIREQHKLLYGHPAFFRDLPKRASGITATKEAVTEDPLIQVWMDKNMPRFDGRLRATGKISTFRTVSFKDNIVLAEQYREIAENLFTSVLKDIGDKDQAEIKVGARFDANNKMESLILKDGKFTGDISFYININEADAQAYTLPDFYRELLFLSGKFSQQQNDQWEYELAYERMARSGKPVSHPSYRPYSDEEIRQNQPGKDNALLKHGNPRAIFPVLKTQYFGYQENSNILHPTFLKHSLQPRFYRMVEGTNFEKLYTDAQSNQIDVIGYESGEKVGNIYQEGTRDFKHLYLSDETLSVSSMPVQSLYTKFFGIQLENSPTVKNSLVRGSQMTKLILSNLFSNGKPLNPEYEEIIGEYFNTLDQIAQLGKTELLEELGLELDSNGHYNTVDIKKMVTLLRDEALKRDMPANIIDAFEASLDENSDGLVYKFDSFSNREKIENILNALVDKRIISPKQHGKAAVQASVSLYENLGTSRSILYLDDNNTFRESNDYTSLTPAQKKTARLASSDLKFYTLDNGRINAMEVYLPHWFAQFYSGSVDINQLDPRLLKVIGFRIPTQALNFIDNIVVKGFLTQEEGDVVIIPSQLTGKSSTDFDIDKLNLLLPNYYIEEHNYESERFTSYMTEDFVKRGMKPEYAEKIMSAFTTEDFIRINRATYSDRGKKKAGSQYSLQDLTDKKDLELVAFIKKSISNYNKTRSGAIRFIEPGTDTREALENKLISIMSRILELPENYRQLIMPSSATTLKALATEMRSLKNQIGESVIPFTQLTEWNYLNQVREQFLVAKMMVGIGAVNVTSHILFQLSNVQLNEYFQDKKIKIHLPHSRIDENVSISSIKNISGRWISELLSEALSSFVDAAKDPFIFEINVNPATGGTFFYLLRCGVDVKQLVYWMNQPILSSYLKEQQLNETLVNKVNQDELSKTFVIANTISDYVDLAYPGSVKDAAGNPATLKTLMERAINDTGDFDYQTGQRFYPHRISFYKSYNDIVTRISSKLESSEMYSFDRLRDSIKTYYSSDRGIKSLNGYQIEHQLAVLMDFLNYQQQASALTDYMIATSYDTFSTKSIVENKLQELNFEKVTQQKFIANPNAVLNKTFLKELKTQKESIPEMFAGSFVSLHPHGKSSFQRIYDLLNNQDLNISMDKKKDLINRFQNFFLGYILHNVPGVNPLTGYTEKIGENKNLFFGDESFAHLLLKLKKDNRYKNNKFIQALYPLISTNRQTFTDNVKLFVSKQSTYEINELMDSIKTLLEHRTEDRVLQSFLNNLVNFAILQSGLQLSPITYSKVLPNEVYSRHIGNIFNGFTNSTLNPLNPDIIYKQFFQNNYNNPSIVPKVSQKFVTDGILYLPVSFVNSNFDFVSVNRININPSTKTTFTREEQKILIKNKSWNQLYTRELYQKFSQDENRAYYHQINKLGNKMYGIETYEQDTHFLDEKQIRFSSINGFVNESGFNDKIAEIRSRIDINGSRISQNSTFLDNNTCS